MVDGAGAGSPDPKTGAGQPDPKTGAGSPDPSKTTGGNDIDAKIQAAVQSAVDETTGRWAKKLEKREKELLAELEAAKGKNGTGTDTGDRVTVKQLEANLKLAEEKASTAGEKASKRGSALKRLLLITELEPAKAVYPSQVAELLTSQVALDENDRLFIPDADGDPKLNDKTGKPMTLAELVAETKAKYPRLFLDGTGSGAGFNGGQGGKETSLADQIASAEKSGNFTLAGHLKAQQLEKMTVR